MKIFISYAHKDEPALNELKLTLEGSRHVFSDIEVWDDSRIPPGGDWHREIQMAIESASVVLLLISRRFMASNYIKDHELIPALKLAANDQRIVVPVIIRETPFWERAMFGHLQALPKGGRPIAKWRDKDSAWSDVVTRLCGYLEERGWISANSAPQPPRANHIVHPKIGVIDHFTGRTAELAWLRDEFAKKDKKPVALLAGLGGIGKTTTALQFAHLNRDDYDVVWWVEAETSESRDLAFAELARRLNLPGIDLDKPDDVRPAVVAWLEATPGWLLVFDNASGPEALKGWRSANPRGHVLITSRDPGWSNVAHRRTVAEWSLAEARGFLLERAESDDTATAEILAERLGCLPLACEQAGAHVVAEQITLAAYLKRFERSLEDILADGAPDDHAPLTTSVKLNLEAAGKDHPLALAILRVLARFAPDDIPRDLLDHWKDADQPAVHKAVRVLIKHALVRPLAENLSIHRLVRDLITAFDPDTDTTAERAVVLLKDNVKACGNTQNDVQHWPRMAALLPHAEALFDKLPNPPPAPEAAGFTCGKLGIYVEVARGDLLAGKNWYARAVAIGEGHLTPDDPRLAIHLSNLAMAHLGLGEFDPVKAFLERAVKIVEAHHGRDHPDVAITVNNLGSVLWRLGDLEGAKARYERALEIDRKAYGADHPMTAIDLNNLGAVLRDQGEFGGAKTHVEQALAIDERHFGPDHPNVAIRLANLGDVLRRQGDLPGARDHLTRALAIREKHLAPQHPDLLLTRQALAAVEDALAQHGPG